MNNTLYYKAVQDFKRARRKAELQNLISRITGDNKKELLSYEEARKKLRAVESGKTELKEIPIDAIVGSVGRYTDFTRDFLPLKDISEQRWASVMEKAISLEGLPPIHVYKLGDAYFVLDGNHRVSVARQLGSKFVEAYVTEVTAPVPIDKNTDTNDLILKEEYARFLEKTNLKQIRPEAELILTCPGQYPILEEHIDVHRYYMGIEQKREIPYEEAVAHWYDHVYRPIVDTIRSQGILRYFPGRTETDLYIWLSKHHAELEYSLGWNISVETAAVDLAEQLSPVKQTERITSRIIDTLLPDAIEAGPPPGKWRAEIIKARKDDTLFRDLLVTISKEDQNWYTLTQAITIAKREKSNILGLHIVQENREENKDEQEALKEKFREICQSNGVQGNLRFEPGTIARQICERARFADIIISHLAHPPKPQPIAKLGSGFRTMILRCPRPILAIPSQVTEMKKPLLAYDGSPKSREALFISAYFAGKWRASLSVITIGKREKAEKIQASAKDYLARQKVKAEYIIQETPKPADGILETIDKNKHDIVLAGGYGASPLIETFLRSMVDQLLNQSSVPILLCR